MMVPTSSVVLVVITLWCMAYNMVKGDAMISTSFGVRRLQTNQTLNFRATYKADFQYLHDFICTAEPPVLQISCYGTFMTILKISDPSIFCVEMDNPIINNGTSYQCTNSCTTCTSIYEASENIADGPFGSIEFMCEGNDVQQVDALYQYLGGNVGSCASSESTTTTRNFHVGRLGVYCPAGSTGSREYLYDDAYVECSYGIETVSGYSQDIAEENENDIYTCVNGDNCRGMQCLVPFGDLRFFAELPRFLNSCVESLVGVPTIPEDPPGTNPSGPFIVQFNASWAQLFPTDSFQTACTSTNPSVLITCSAGSSIAFINSTDISMDCIDLNGSELRCTGDPGAIKDTFVSVIYTCAGSSLPESQVMYPESSASCIGSTKEETVSHTVSLGLLCKDSVTTELFYYYGDRAFECAEAGHSFDYEGKLYGWDTLRFICSETMTFGVGSTSPQTVRNVTITTDESWRTNPDDNCYNVVPFATAPTAPVANPPTVSPTITSTASPTIPPTASPIEIVSVSPTTSPSTVTVPTMKPVVTTVAPVVINSAAPPVVSQESPNEDNGNSVVGIAIGSAVGGVALAAVIGFLFFFMKRDQAGSASKPTNESHYTESNTNDDFTSSSRPPTTPHDYMGYSATASLVQPSPVSHQPQPPPLYPITEVPSSNNHRYANNEVIEPKNKRDVFVPPPDMPMPAVRTSITRQSATSSHRSSYPTNHVVELKDQCRSVAMVRSSSPTLVSPTVDHNNTTIPFAVALGVSTTTTNTQPSVTSSTSSRTSKKEPAGRILDDC